MTQLGAGGTGTRLLPELRKQSSAASANSHSSAQSAPAPPSDVDLSYKRALLVVSKAKYFSSSGSGAQCAGELPAASAQCAARLDVDVRSSDQMCAPPPLPARRPARPRPLHRALTSMACGPPPQPQEGPPALSHGHNSHSHEFSDSELRSCYGTRLPAAGAACSFERRKSVRVAVELLTFLKPEEIRG